MVLSNTASSLANPSLPTTELGIPLGCILVPLGTNPSFPGQNIEGTLPGNAQCTEDVPTWNIAGKF